MLNTDNPYFVSVFIPVYNGSDTLKECISSVLSQDMPKGVKLELIIIDSGSKDGSVEIIKSFSDKRIVFKEIKNSDFGHGKTRQMGAEMAKGRYILFLTQDATPMTNRWLINMIEPFLLNSNIGCVFGRQVPRPNAAATIKREVAFSFASLGPTDSLMVHRWESLVDNKKTNQLNSFFSDVNSAVRKDLVISNVPFRDVRYAEDQGMGEDMQRKGYMKAYTPIGAVWHSNDYTAREYYKRKFDEYIGIQETLGVKYAPSEKLLLLGWVRPTLLDIKFIWQDKEYGPRRKIIWWIKSPFYNIANQRGRYYASKMISDQNARDKNSLESSLKS